MSYTRKGRYAIYIGRLPSGFTPTAPTDQPETIESSGLLWPTSPGFGQRFCLAYNARQLATGIPGRRWAFAAFRPKRRLRPCAAEDRAVRELLDTLPSTTTNCREAAGREA